MMAVTESPFFLFLIAAVLVAGLIPLAARLAHKLDFLDVPGGRKKHENAIPPVGGVVIFPVFLIVALLAGVFEHYGFAAALLVLLLVGFIDDYRTVPARYKFIAQFAAAFILVLGSGVRVADMGDIFGFGPLGLGPFSIPFTIIAIVLLINAINLLDGLDGLAAGIGFVIFGWLLIFALAAGGQVSYVVLLSIIMGGLAGFLAYNMRHPWRKQASVFLGDAGSLCLGLTVAWLCIDMSKNGTVIIQPMGVAWLLALPIMDTCGQFARRVAQGRHPFDPDHDHFHHHFINAGFSVARATMIILLIVAICGGIAAVAQFGGLSQAVLTYPWIALLFTHIYFSMRPARFRRLIQRLSGARS